MFYFVSVSFTHLSEASTEHEGTHVAVSQETNHEHTSQKGELPHWGVGVRTAGHTGRPGVVDDGKGADTMYPSVNKRSRGEEQIGELTRWHYRSIRVRKS